MPAQDEATVDECSMTSCMWSDRPLKGHDRNTAKKQHAGLIKAWINNDCAPTVKHRVVVISVLLELKQPSAVRLPKERTTIGTWSLCSLYACRNLLFIATERFSPMSWMKIHQYFSGGTFTPRTVGENSPMTLTQ